MDKDRLDWPVGPPPDRVIEIDVTPYTAATDYAPYGAPEVWLFKNQGLKLDRLQGSADQEVVSSQSFPAVNLVE